MSLGDFYVHFGRFLTPSDAFRPVTHSFPTNGEGMRDEPQERRPRWRLIRKRNRKSDCHFKHMKGEICYTKDQVLPTFQPSLLYKADFSI